MSRKGESIYKRNDGRYEARYIKNYINNKAVYGYVYAKTYNECKRKKNELLLSYNVEKPIVKKSITKDLNYLIDKWLNTKNNLKESSYSLYLTIINSSIKNDIGKTKISKLNSKIINNYLNNLLNKNKLSNNYVYVVRSILNQVFKDNNININMMKISLSVGKGKSLYNSDKNKLINELNKLNNNISIGILLSLFLGLRKSEVCGLKYSDIDIENDILYINNIVSRVKSFDTKNKTKLTLTKPKTDNSIRILPIPEKILYLLHNINIKNKEFYLLTNNSNFMDPRTFYNHYKRIIKDLNIDYTYHDLRHTFATNCIEIGIDYKSLMELLGHSSINTTLSIYVHPSINNKRIFINQL